MAEEIFYSALHWAKKAEKSASEAALHNLKNKITNCITEIPQDIKLELNDGTLTLKAGSKVYVPNGANKFDEVVIASDLSVTGVANRQTTIFYKNNGLQRMDTEYCYSSSSAPTVSTANAIWYDTTNNVIKVTNDKGANWTTGNISLPVARVTETTSSITSIDQVFNGFGYIGSTAFALPGVKGLIPNGRNSDGSLKNIEFTVDKVILRTDTTSTRNNHDIAMSTNGIGLNVYTYNEEENYLYTGSTRNNDRFLIGKISQNNGVITSFQPKLPFHAVDRNDSSWLSGLAMPSNKYIDLTLGATGSTYTAPANGYFVFAKKSTSAGQYIAIANTNNGLKFAVNVQSSGQTPEGFILCQKGDPIKVEYNTGGETVKFIFIYAEGEVN